MTGRRMMMQKPGELTVGELREMTAGLPANARVRGFFDGEHEGIVTDVEVDWEAAEVKVFLA